MDQSLWQTLGSFDFVHQQRERVQTMLLCVKNSTTMQVGAVSKLSFCRRFWRLKVHLRGKFCAHSEVEHSCQYVGCARNKHQSHTVPLNLKLCLWMLVCAWRVFPLLTFGIWLLRYCNSYQYMETCCATKSNGNTPTPKRWNASTEMMFNCSMWLTLPQTQNLLTLAPCLTFSKTMKR